MKLDNRIKENEPFEFLFSNQLNFKDFLKNIFLEAKYINIKTGNKFNVIFTKTSEVKKNEYLLTDYRILIIAFLKTLKEKNYEKEKYFYIRDLLSCKESKNDHYNLTRSLLFYLDRRKITYFISFQVNFFNTKRYAKNTNKVKYVVSFYSISLNYKEIKNLFEEDKELLNEIDNVLDRSYKKYTYRRNLKKTIERFSIRQYFEEFMKVSNHHE